MTSKKQQEEYLKKISKTEEHLHNITKENRKIQAELAQLEEDVQRNVRQMQEINEKLASHGSPHSKTSGKTRSRDTRISVVYEQTERKPSVYVQTKY